MGAFGGGWLGVRELELRKAREWPKLDEEVPVWALYLDDSTFLKKIEDQLEERLTWLQGICICRQQKIKFVGLVENVVMDDLDRDEISCDWDGSRTPKRRNQQCWFY